jgi:hypothetical protein
VVRQALCAAGRLPTEIGAGRQIMTMRDGGAGPGLFGVARFEAGEVRDVLIPFETEEAADAAAAGKGWSHYDVCRLRFGYIAANHTANRRR